MLTHWGGLECQTRALLTLVLHSFNHIFRKCQYLSTLFVDIVLVYYYMLWWLAALSMRWCTCEMRRHSFVRQRPKTTKHQNVKSKSKSVRQSFSKRSEAGNLFLSKLGWLGTGRIDWSTIGRYDLANLLGDLLAQFMLPFQGWRMVLFVNLLRTKMEQWVTTQFKVLVECDRPLVRTVPSPSFSCFINWVVGPGGRFDLFFGSDLLRSHPLICSFPSALASQYYTALLWDLNALS